MVRPIALAERFIDAQPRVLAAILGQAAQLGAGVEKMVGGLPAIATRAAMDHHPHVTAFAIDLHLDEMVTTADRAQLRRGLGIGAIDRLQIGVLGNRDVLALAQVGVDADRFGTETQDVVGFAVRKARHLVRTVRADAGRHALFDGCNPTRALAPIGDVLGFQLRHAHVQHAARDVVTRASLNDGVLGHDHAADRHAVAGVCVGHEVRADHAGVRSAGGELLPHRLFRCVEQRLREERVRVGTHRAGARQHVVVRAHLLGVVLERHDRSLLSKSSPENLVPKAFSVRGNRRSRTSHRNGCVTG